MARRRKRSEPGFNLAFLDIMSCGFGAVILLFLMLKHAEVTSPSVEATRLQQDILVRTERLSSLEGELASLESTLQFQSSASDALLEKLAALKAAIKALQTQNDTSGTSNDALMKSLVAEQKKLDKKLAADRAKLAGQGVQKFVTGMRVEGRHIVLMLDRSASMVDERLVDITIRRAKGGRALMLAPKWTQATRSLSWLVNQLPKDAMVRILSFSETAQWHGSPHWIPVNNTPALLAALNEGLAVRPEGGTNLTRAFEAIAPLRPKADSVYLITDGLPTKGRKPSNRTTVSGDERLKLFNEARRVAMASRAKVNTILLPLEGDPEAAFAFWRMAHETSGRVLSPAKDWP